LARHFSFPLATALVAVLTAGCAAPVAVNVVRNPQFNYSATDAKAVAIHSSPPAAEYEVIGEVRTRVSAGVPMDQVEASLKEEGARIGANAVVIVVKDVVTEQKIQRPAAGSQQPIGTSGAPGGGGVATLPTQTGRTEEVTIRVHEKEITGVVIRFKKK
jgi:hypothetical protein